MRQVSTLVLLVTALLACRTSIAPIVKPKPTSVYVGEKTCEVFDYESAADLPAGAKSLGAVQVRWAGSDDDTYVKLREKICALGGDALSQVAWVREAGEYAPSSLKANAWVLP